MSESHAWEHRTGKALSVFRLDSIKNKIVVLALVATLVPTVATVTVFYVQNEQVLAEKIDEGLRSAGLQGSRELGRFIQDRYRDVGVFVTSFVVWGNLQRVPTDGPGEAQAALLITDYLSAVQPRSEYAELVVLDREGGFVAASDTTSGGVALAAGWQEALRGEDVLVGDPYWDPDRGSALVLIARRIIDPVDESYLGVLIATLDLRAVDEEVLVDYAPDGGLARVITADGRVIASSRGISEGSERVGDAAVRALRENPGATAEYDGADGGRVLGTLHPTSELDWAVVAEVPRRQAYEPIARLRNVALLLVAGLLVVVGSIGYFLGQVIVRPLGRLTAGAGEVASGDLSVDLPVIGKGEVGYLTEVFNDMVGRLRRGREALDKASDELRLRNVELERLSVTDGLTELVNRRRAMEVLADEVKRAERLEHDFSLLMLDVDHFKKYNDTWGHLEGDAVLQGVARTIQDAIRGIDTAARYGGEEFMVLLPKCDETGAAEAATRILSHLAAAEFKGGPVTMSIGVASYPQHGDSPDGLIRAADEALYQAKEQGRNRYVASGAKPRKKSPAKRGAAARRKPKTGQAGKTAKDEPKA